MNLLLTSAGRRSYMVKYFKEALNGKGKVLAANSVFSAALKAADDYVITPLIYDNIYVEFLLDFCKKKNIGALISLFDIDLPILAKFKKIFEENNIMVIVSDYEVTQICNDKWKTYEFLIEFGFFSPKTFIQISDAEELMESEDLNFPLIIKPRWGMGSIGIYQAENINELKIFYNKTKNEIKSSYLKYESSIDFERSVILQEKLIGQEYGLDVINDLNKNFVTTFVKRKTAMRAGETDGAIIENNPILYNLGEKISKNLGHIANLDVDCFLVKEKPFILEMNCRFGGHYPFSHLAGANLPLAILKWLQNEKPQNELFKIKYGTEGIKDILPIVINSLDD